MLRVAILVLLFVPLASFAYYYNDSDLIELGSGEPKLLPEKETSPTQGGQVTPGGYITVQGAPPPGGPGTPVKNNPNTDQNTTPQSH